MRKRRKTHSAAEPATVSPGSGKAARRRDLLEQGEIVELSDAWLEFPEGRCYARVSLRGSKAYLPVVCVHGFGISSSYFVPTAERLAPHLDVYVPDLPGHGKSYTPQSPLDMQGFACFLADWMGAMRIERASIVANSMGCQVAAELARVASERVDRLVLIGPTVDSRYRSLWRLVPRFSYGGIYQPRSLTRLVVKDYSRMRIRLFWELRAMLAHRIDEALAAVDVPVLFVRGEHDTIVSQHWLEELASLIREARVLVVPGAGHAVNYGSAERLVPSILPFLREASRKTA